MPSLEQISESAAIAHEQCVRDSMAMDYAYFADVEARKRGEPAGRLRGWIENRYAALIGVPNDSGNAGGSGSGANP